MTGLVRRFTILIIVVVSSAVSAAAEDLIMPFSCVLDGEHPRLTPSNETTYRIIGPRDEQSFARCPVSRRDTCETLMVHRFVIACGGARVPWAKIFDAARSIGIAPIDGLPNGFAPISRLSGRIVLPALTHQIPHITNVATVDLSPDSVVEEVRPEPIDAKQGWTTTVRADGGLFVAHDALRAGAVAMILTALMGAACLFVAHRGLGSPLLPGPAQALRDKCRDVFERWTRTPGNVWEHESLANGIAILEARMAETELQTAALPRELLLREVIDGELGEIRRRFDAMRADRHRWSRERSAAKVRQLLRDLERVSKIAHGAAQNSAASFAAASPPFPQSEAEAYSTLGINADVAPAVAKKLIDALRQTWHPDLARDEADRRRREDRMKQINAAWDLIRHRRAAA